MCNLQFNPVPVNLRQVFDNFEESTTVSSSTTSSKCNSTKNVAVPIITGTIYIDHTESGYILEDQRFKYHERLKDKKESPLRIEKDDFYLAIEGEIKKATGWFSTERFDFRDKINLPNNRLPASLFKDVKEGEAIQFYWDEQFVELICKQETHPKCPNQSSFEKILALVKERINAIIKLPVFLEDVDNSNLWMKSIPQQYIYETDQFIHGPYKKLDLISHNINKIIFHLSSYSSRVKISEIDLIMPDTLNGAQYYGIFIRHKPEENPCPQR